MKITHPKALQWLISLVVFVIVVLAAIVVSDFWLYREFSFNQKTMVDDALDNLEVKVNYSLTQIENILVRSIRGINIKNSKLNKVSILKQAKIPEDIKHYITKINILPAEKYYQNYTSRRFAKENGKYYFVVTSELLNNDLMESYLDFNKIIQKYVSNISSLFDIQFYFSLSGDQRVLDQSKKPIKTQYILGHPEWRIYAYLKSDANELFAKKLILLSVILFLIIFYIAYWSYVRLSKLAKLNFKITTDKQAAEEKIRHLAYYDNLTGLPNKVSLIKYYQGLLEDKNLLNYKLFTIAINIPTLQAINDTIGYQYGDAALLRFVEVVEKFVASCDFIVKLNKDDKFLYRLSGNTFIIGILIHAGKSEKSAILIITNFLNNLLRELNKSLRVKEEDLYFQYYFGISIYPDDFSYIKQDAQIAPEIIYRFSEIAMSAARKKGLNKYIFYSEEINSSILQKFNLENELRRALDNNKLELLLQPQVILANNKLRGFEALIRWQREDGSVVSPGKFIPILEQSGLIVTVGDWILQEACRQGMELLSKNIDFEILAVNISILQLQSENFVDRMSKILQLTKFPESKLEIEVTESILFDNPDRVINVLNEIRAQNIKTALDDFGTGFSSLSYLKILPIDYLKIDRSFVNEITITGDARLLLAILAIAKSLNLFSIVEGVETQQQVDFLRTTSCDIIQGYYICKPLVISEIIKLYQNK